MEFHISIQPACGFKLVFHFVREAIKWIDDEVQTLLSVFHEERIQTLSLRVFERIVANNKEFIM